MVRLSGYNSAIGRIASPGRWLTWMPMFLATARIEAGWSTTDSSRPCQASSVNSFRSAVSTASV
jgi:hypothetical protein